MAGSLVIRTGLTIVGSLPSGTGDPQLTVDAASKQVGSIPSVDPSSYLSTALPNGQIFVGNGSNLAAAVTATGAISITNAGVVTLNSGIVFNSNINALAAIDYSKLNLAGGIINNDINAAASIARTKIANGTAYRVVVNNATGVMSDNSAITANRALISDANGLPTHSTVTSTTLAFLDATSSVQAQLNTKLTFTASPSNGDVIYYNSGAWNRLGIGSSGQVLVVTAGLPAWGAPVANGVPTGGTAGQYLNKIDATNYNTQWSTLVLASLTDVTASAAQVNVLATGFYDATSSVQTQLSLKLDKTLTQNYLFIGNISNVAVPFATGPNGYILTSVGGVPTWVAPTGGGTVTSVAASGGTTGLSFTGSPITLSGTLTLTGTLGIANGGTGSTTFPGWLLASGGALTADNTLSGGFAVDFNTVSRLSITQSVQTVSWSKAFNITPGSHTGLTATVEFTGLATNVGAFTQQWATGTLARQRWNYYGSPTIAFVGVSTVTNAYNVYIEPVVAGTNATIANNWALGVNGNLHMPAASAQLILSGSGGVVTADNMTANTVLIASSFFYVGAGTSAISFTNPSNLGRLNIDTFTNGKLLGVTMTQGAFPSGWGPALRTNTGAHTSITAASEFPDFVFGGLSSDANTAVSTRTATWLAGTVATQRSMYIKGTILTGASATASFTNAYTVFIDPPVQGANASISSAWALGTAGSVLFSQGTGLPTLRVINTGNGGTSAVFDAQSVFGGLMQYGGSGLVLTGQSGVAIGNIPILKLIGGVLSAQTASTELTDANFDFSRTVTWATGGITTQRSMWIKGINIAFAAASAVTNPYSLYIDPPVQGTNATFTNGPWALGLNGKMKFVSSPTNDNAQTQLLTVDATTGEVKYRTVASLPGGGGGWAVTGSTTITGNTTQTGAFTNNFALDGVTITQNVKTSGTPTAFTVTGGAHTGLTAATNPIDIRFALARIVQLATGTVSLATEVTMDQTTYAFVGASTINDAAILYLSGLPQAGTNATILRSWSMIAAGPISVTGKSYFGNNFINANSTIEIEGSFGPSITSVSATTTLDATHYTVTVDASGAARTINLPAAGGVKRRVYIIKKIDSSANNVTIDGNSTETIDGALTKVINTQWAGFQIQSDGTNWIVIATF